MPPTQRAIETPLPKLPALLNVWRVIYVCLGSLLGLLAGCFVVWLGVELAWTARMLALCLILPTLVLAWLGWFYAGKRFAAYGARLHAGQGVALRDGVWWQSEAWVPMTRLQYLDVNQGPLDRRWGMATLSLRTASAHDHTTRIAGLPLQEAHALRMVLLPLTRSEHE